MAAEGTTGGGVRNPRAAIPARISCSRFPPLVQGTAMRRQYLCDCAPGDLLEDVYVISGKQFSPTTTGKHYIKAFVSDRTCQVTARMWNATREIFSTVPDGGFARI